MKKEKLFGTKRKENMAHLKTTWRHVRRSPYQAFAAIFIIMQTFFVVSLFTFVIVGSAKIINYFESLPQITAFFKNDAKQDQINQLKSDLEKSDKVSSVKFVSKQDALKIYREQNKNDPLLLDLVTADILPASLEISAGQIQDLGSISETLKGSTFIQEVVFPKDIVANLTKWTNALRKIGLALILVLVLDSIFIMVIIIGIKISQKREEIEIMRLIGATNWYIRWPFIFEGIIYGIVGAIIGWALSSALVWFSLPQISSFIGAIPLLPISPVFLAQLLGLEILLAIVLGTVSSFFAVLRYLK